jgi:hypothetical protein
VCDASRSYFRDCHPLSWNKKWLTPGAKVYSHLRRYWSSG